MILNHLKSMDQLSEKKMKEERDIIRLELSIIQKKIAHSKTIDLPTTEKKIRMKEQSIVQDYHRYYVHMMQLKELLQQNSSPLVKILWARYVQYIPWNKILPNQKYPAPFVHPRFIEMIEAFYQ